MTPFWPGSWKTPSSPVRKWTRPSAVYQRRPRSPDSKRGRVAARSTQLLARRNAGLVWIPTHDEARSPDPAHPRNDSQLAHCDWALGVGQAAQSRTGSHKLARGMAGAHDPTGVKEGALLDGHRRSWRVGSAAA